MSKHEYESKEMPVVFKITPVIYPSNLDEKLISCGYRKDSPTSVQTMELEPVNAQVAPEANLQEDLSDDWLDNFCRMSTIPVRHRETLQKILGNIIPRHCFVSFKSGDRVVACGLGVLQSEHIGLFDIVTETAFRGRGYGKHVVKNILAWGKQNEAKKAYLQVMLDNAPAIHLYAKIGFKEKYQYWYRIKSSC